MSSKQLSASPLGKASAIVSYYDSQQLCSIPRGRSWQDYGHDAAPWSGVDIWNAWELSWLNPRGLPQIAIGEFRVPASSPNLVESKSLKLYLNSFAQSKFADDDNVCRTIEADLSGCAGAAVEVRLLPVDNVAPIATLPGTCIDRQDVAIEHYTRDASLLRCEDRTVQNEQLFSHLLKTNCPVTAQPDWGSVYIEYSGQAIDRAGLLKYIVSLREQCDFHEQCVESIFLDIMQRCQPGELSVYARYLRRGGLDINPWRTSTGRPPVNTRLSRQ